MKKLKSASWIVVPLCLAFNIALPQKAEAAVNLNPNNTYYFTHDYFVPDPFDESRDSDEGQWIPNFSDSKHVQAPHEIVTSQRDGNWVDGNMWDKPLSPNSVVQVRHDVVFDAASSEVAVVGIYAGGQLRFSRAQSSTLKVIHMLVHEGGYLEMGTEGQPMPSNIKAQIIFRNTPINNNPSTGLNQSFYDPAEYGNGLLVFGKVRMHGAQLSPTFVRLSQDAPAGETTLNLAQPVTGWKAGDKLCLPDTRMLTESEYRDNYSPQWEYPFISSVLGDGRSITVSPPLQFKHEGPRNADGTLTILPNGETLMPHVGNLTRNVVVKSEDPNGVRGITTWFYRADVDVRYTEFADLGRTKDSPGITTVNFDAAGNPLFPVGTANLNGRLPLRLFGLIGPVNTPASGHQFVLQGNAVSCSLPYKVPFVWPIQIRGSSYGLVNENVVANWAGAGLFVSAASAYNVIEKNFVMGMRGSRNPRDNSGLDAICYFSNAPQGVHNYWRGNVAANSNTEMTQIVTGQGFDFLLPSDYGFRISEKIPKRPGSDTQVEGEYDLIARQSPILEFTGNEAYGAMQTGLTIWNLGNGNSQIGETIIKDFTAWHTSQDGFFGYPVRNITFDRFVVRGHPRWTRNIGWNSGDYNATNVTIRGADIQGMGGGIGGSSNIHNVIRIEDSYFRNHGSGITERFHATPGTGNGATPVQVIISSCKFEAFPGKSLRTISMYYISPTDTDFRSDYNYISPHSVIVRNYQEVSGDDFQVFFHQQDPAFIVPQSNAAADLTASPVAGLTNQQNWDQFGIAMAGAVARCTDSTTRPEIVGFTCPLIDDTTPPSIPQNLVATARSGSQIDLSWGASTDAESTVSHYKIYRNGAFLRNTTALTFSNINLTEDTAYAYEVSAVNTADLESTKTPAVTARTAADRVLPVISSVISEVDPTKVIVTFSEPVEQTSAMTVANYAIDNGITIESAVLEAGNRSVSLKTSPVSGGLSYTLTVNNVKDRARTPNLIAPNSTAPFTFSSTSNNASPSVNAGPNQTVSFPSSVNLNGTATDDGLPSTPGAITVLWGMVSGPGTVTFSDDAFEDPVANFSAAGTYVLRLTAFDGQFTSTDDVTLVLTGSGGEQAIPKFKNILNPARGETVSMPVTGEASVDIYTKNGSLVRRLKDNGSGSIDWDGRNEKGEIVSSGVYLWKIKLGNSGGKTETRKVVVLK